MPIAFRKCDVRGALVARLERCDLVGPFRSIYYQWSGAAHVFDHCRFTNLTEMTRSQVERGPDQVRFVNCTFEYMSGEAQQSRPAQRDPSEINPAWTE